MKCPKCGKETLIEADEGFVCKNCGANVYFEKEEKVLDMYKNIGGKIKTLAVIITILEIISSIVVGAFFLSNQISVKADVGMIIVMALVFFVGVPLLLWIKSFFTYGYGELIESSKKREKEMESILRSLSEMGEKTSGSDDRQ